MNWHCIIKFSRKSIRELSYPKHWMNWLTIEALHPLMLCSILLVDNEGKHFSALAQDPFTGLLNRAVMVCPLVMALVLGTAAYRNERIIVEERKQHPIGNRFVIWQGWRNPILWSQPSIIARARCLGHCDPYRQPARHRMKKLLWLKTMRF